MSITNTLTNGTDAISNPEYRVFIVAYDYAKVLEGLGLACDEAFQLAQRIVEHIGAVDSYDAFQSELAFVFGNSFKDDYEARRRWLMRQGCFPGKVYECTMTKTVQFSVIANDDEEAMQWLLSNDESRIPLLTSNYSVSYDEEILYEKSPELSCGSIDIRGEVNM